jgi:hypothetical protein
MHSVRFLPERNGIFPIGIPFRHSGAQCALLLMASDRRERRARLDIAAATEGQGLAFMVGQSRPPVLRKR